MIKPVLHFTQSSNLLLRSTFKLRCSSSKPINVIINKNQTIIIGVSWDLHYTICNRFKILAEEDEHDHVTKLIGDSIIIEQLDELYGIAKTTRKKSCMPGARLNDITATRQPVCPIPTLLIIHEITNYVMITRSE